MWHALTLPILYNSSLSRGWGSLKHLTAIYINTRNESLPVCKLTWRVTECVDIEHFQTSVRRPET